MQFIASSSKVLTREQELDIGRTIVGAECALLAALVRAPAGAAALAALGRDLGEGRLDSRALLLNPDEQGLDVAATTERVRAALLSATACDERGRASIVETLADARLDRSVIDGVVAAVRAAGDAAALEKIDEARSDIRRAKERLVLANLRLVIFLARRYQNQGVPLLDLVQEGNIGLMRAADKFDLRRNVRFNTYAAWWIKQALQRALVDRPLRLPIHLTGDRRRVSRVRARFAAQHDREPTVDEIAKLTGLSVGRVQAILEIPSQPVSLDAPMGDQGDTRLIDFVAAEMTPADRAVETIALGDHLDRLLAGLSERELRVLRMRFGIGPTPSGSGPIREHTLEEIGRELSLTRERIRQIEHGALQKLRVRSKRSDLSSFLEA